MKTLIIDDDRKAIEYLQQQLADYPDVTIEAVATSGLEGLRLISEKHPELLFLDIEMPDISGIDFLERMDNYTHSHCRVVMYSAYDRFMLPAFRNSAFDFLVKPFGKEELRTVMNRVYAGRKYCASAAPTVAEGGKYLLYTNAVDFRLVNIRDIGLFQYNSSARCWEVVIAGCEEPVKLKRSVNSDAIRAVNADFVQVHQRFIINMNYLMEVSDNSCRFFPPFDTIDDVKVGRFYRRKLVERFSAL